MIFLQSNWILAFVCAYIFYGAGKFEASAGTRGNAVLWAGLSIAISALVIRVFGGGWFFVLAAQVTFFVGIGIVRTLVESKGGPGK